jgi:hypothetical protein
MFVSKMERKEPSYYNRSDGIHSRPDVMQLKNPSTKTRVLCSLTVRSSFAVRPDASERAAPED